MGMDMEYMVFIVKLSKNLSLPNTILYTAEKSHLSEEFKVSILMVAWKSPSVANVDPLLLTKVLRPYGTQQWGPHPTAPM